MILQYLRRHESRRAHKPPGTLCGRKLADPVIRQLDEHGLKTEWARDGQADAGVGELPDEDVVALEVAVDDGGAVEVLHRLRRLGGGGQSHWEVVKVLRRFCACMSYNGDVWRGV